MNKITRFLTAICICLLLLIQLTAAYSQQGVYEISGTVTDQTGEPLIGVDILIEGTTTGVITNSEGNYSIRVGSSEAVLVYSYIGYTSQSIRVGNRTIINVVMEEKVTELDQIVVIGYGTVKKRDLTGSVSSITEEEIQRVPVTSVDQALQGKVSGVNVINTSGIPGKRPTVLIGGIGTVNNNEPLYVVDGFPTKEGIMDINPMDIVSIDVLKDASAAAIYGARGANGVIMITTRRGTKGKPVVSLETYYGVQEPYNLYQVLGKNDFVALYNEEKENDMGRGMSDLYYYTRRSLDPFWEYEVGDTIPWEVMPDENYVDAMFRSAPVMSTQLSVVGGSETNQYALSGGYLKQDGIFIGTGYERMSFRINTDNQITDFLTIGNSLNIARAFSRNVQKTGYGTSFTAEEGYFATEIMEQAFERAPYYPIYDPEGGYSIAQFPNAITNPVGNALRFEDTNLKTSILASVYADLTIFEGLTYKLNAGLNNSSTNARRYEPVYLESNGGRTEAFAREGNMTRYGWLVENTLNYQNTFGLNNVTVLAGTSAQNQTAKNFTAQKQDFPHPELQQLSSASGTADAFGGYSERSTLSFFGRINYAYDDKYLMSATLRHDGSSKFGPENRFGTFPSFAVAWRISEESFMQNLTSVSDLKVRFGYGQIGNDEISDFIFLSTLSDVTYVNGDELVAGIVPNKVPNREVKWESTITQNLGIDLSLWRNQFLLTLDLYNRDTKDMLLNQPIPRTSGFNSVVSNLGGVNNRGINLTTSFRKAYHNFSYGISANASYNKNKITALTEAGESFISYQNITRSEVGYPIASFYGYIMEGVFQDPTMLQAAPFHHLRTAPGDVIYRDIDGDNRITDYDVDFIGSPWPDLIYGANTEAAYKGISLSVGIQGVYGNDIYNASDVRFMGMNTTTNSSIRVLDRWQAPVYRDANTGDEFVLYRDAIDPENPDLQMVDPGNPSNTIPRAVFGDPANNRRVSTRFIEDGSYLRISNVSLNYTLPAGWVQRLSIQSIRIYAKVNNLYVFTKFSGMDPEVATAPGGSILSTGIYYNNIPNPRVYMVGLNISL
jgi:TonB-dependent starch-binding outer membrane protein SusC